MGHIMQANDQTKNDEESQELTDQGLIRAFLQGDQDAATALYQRYAEQLRVVAIRQSSSSLTTRIDPDDIVQSVFRTFFRRLTSDRYEAPEGDSLWKLFLVIALNKIRRTASYHKAAKRDVRQTISLGELPVAQNKDEASEQADATDLQTIIAEMLADLPESSREIIRLRIDGLPVNEIATATGRAKRSVERVLQQFRNQLKAQLDEDIQD